jgi:predicted MFS family arabinose efflux permease
MKGSQKSAWQGLRLVFKNSPALAGLLMGAAMSSANELVNLTFGVWMETSFNIQIAALAVVALVIGVSELAGEGLVGLFADRIGKARAVTIGLFLNSLAALILPVIGRNAAGGVIGLGLFYLTFEFTLVSSIPLMTEVLPSARATLMASWIASISAGRAIGALLAPYLYAPGQSSGILFIVLVCGLFNLAAYLSLRKVKTAEALLLQNLPGSG